MRAGAAQVFEDIRFGTSHLFVGVCKDRHRGAIPFVAYSSGQ